MVLFPQLLLSFPFSSLDVALRGSLDQRARCRFFFHISSPSLPTARLPSRSFRFFSRPYNTLVSPPRHSPSLPLEINTLTSRPQPQGLFNCARFTSFPFSLSSVLRVTILPVLYDSELFFLQRMIDIVLKTISAMYRRDIVSGYKESVPPASRHRF